MVFFSVICILRCTCQLDGTLWYFHTDRLIETAGRTVTITTGEKFSFGVQVTNFSSLRMEYLNGVGVVNSFILESFWTRGCLED